jgi:hypothetical protein
MKITSFHQTVNSRSGDFIEITDDMLIFQIKNQQGDKSILNGVYVRKILVNTILFSVNNEYKVNEHFYRYESAVTIFKTYECFIIFDS